MVWHRVVERTHSWLDRCWRMLARAGEKHADTCIAMRHTAHVALLLGALLLYWNKFQAILLQKK